jgi:diguanylate cyclase (GGDEF)-like protein/PAS domain S-box-containing protein
MSDQTIKYAKLVDVTSLQTLMDGLNRVIGIANAIIDTDGIVITRSGWQDSCIKFHRVNPQTCANCIESDTSLAKSMFKGEAFAIYNCLNGLVDTAMPIVVDGQHVANVFTGQCFTTPPDLEFFRRQARQYGFEEHSYLKAVSEVPVIPRTRIETITQMYAQLAQTLAANGLDRLRQQQATSELERLNNELARRVEERTRELSDKNLQLQQETRALVNSEARLTALFENMSSGVAVYKATDDAQDFIFLAFNKAAETIEKISRHDVIGRRLTEIFPNVVEFGLLDVLRRVAKTGQSEVFPESFYQDGRIHGWRDNYLYQLPNGETVAIYDDVTERKRAEQTLQLTQFSVDCAIECMYWITADARFRFVNNTACQFLGYSREELLTLSLIDIDSHYSVETWSTHWREVKRKSSLQFESLHLTKDGREIPVEIATNYIVFDECEYQCAFVRDISERKALLAELERQAHIDYLTGIANRRYFMELGEIELARAQRYGCRLSVFMLDIDYFKSINDTHGHAVGDKVLQRIGGLFAETLREIDISGRLGGEEFAVLLPETSHDEAVEVAERLRAEIARSKIPLESGLPLQFTICIGIASLKEKNTNIDTLLNLADKALYRAKQTGRNKICVQQDWNE